jgi:hypothetical protein
MLLMCKLGERPSYLARFPDGSQIQLPPAVHATIEMMSRFTGLQGKRIKDIANPEELASALEAFWRDLGQMYAQAAEALPWATPKLATGRPEDASK